MAKNKTNWDKLSQQTPLETVQGRDVYEDQQFDRSKIGNKQKPTSRIIFVTIVTLFVAVLLWFLIAGIQFGVDYSASAKTGASAETSEYPYVTSIYDVHLTEDGTYQPSTLFYATDRDGNPVGEGYEDPADVPVPDWYTADVEAGVEVEAKGAVKPFSKYLIPDLTKVLIVLTVSALLWLLLYQIMMRNLEAQNALETTDDINQYVNDQHIQLPEEVQSRYDWFPDVGAHSSVQVSSMISHMALQNKGIHKIKVARRADKDILDEDGEIMYHKGEVLMDENGEVIYDTLPMFDSKFMDDLFTASGAPKDKAVRKFYDATKIPYNPGNKSREKLQGYDTVADLINKDWFFPSYEPQRPGGAYIVDTFPVNTMV